MLATIDRAAGGDFAGVPVEGSYPLVYAVFNTLFSLLTQDDQDAASRR